MPNLRCKGCGVELPFTDLEIALAFLEEHPGENIEDYAIPCADCERKYWENKLGHKIMNGLSFL